MGQTSDWGRGPLPPLPLKTAPATKYPLKNGEAEVVRVSANGAYRLDMQSYRSNGLVNYQVQGVRVFTCTL